MPNAAFGHEQLLRSAQAAAGALAVAMVVGGFLVKTATGAFVPPKTAVRVGGVVAALVALGLFTPRFGRLLTPVVAAAVAGGLPRAARRRARAVASKDLAMASALRGKRAPSARP